MADLYEGYASLKQTDRHLYCADLLYVAVAGFHLREGDLPGKCGPVYHCHRAVADARERVHRQLVHKLRGRRGAHIRSDRGAVPLYAEVLCRRTFRGSERIRKKRNRRAAAPVPPVLIPRTGSFFIIEY